MKNLLISFLLVLGALKAQGPLPAYYRESFELMGTGATTITNTHSVTVTRTSGTVLTIGDGASATLPQTVRAMGSFNGEYYTRQFTSANTLTSAAGGISGTIWIYVLPSSGVGTTITSFTTVVISNLGGTLNCTGTPTCQVVSQQSATARQAIARGVYVAAATMTAGSPATFDVSGLTTVGTNVNAWVRAISITNITGGAVTVSLADGKGLPYGTTLSIAANTTYELSMGQPGYERFFERGLVATASAVSSVYITTRWVTAKLTFSPAAPY